MNINSCTPGPWSVIEEYITTSIAGTHGIAVAKCTMMFPYRYDDALLMAAAPELFGALHMMIFDSDGVEQSKSKMTQDEWAVRINDAKKLAKIAMAKATTKVNHEENNRTPDGGGTTGSKCQPTTSSPGIPPGNQNPRQADGGSLQLWGD